MESSQPTLSTSESWVLWVCSWSKRPGTGRRGRMWINEYLFPATSPGCLRKWWASRGNWGRHLRWACYRRAIQQQACSHGQKSPRFFIPVPCRKNTKGAGSSLSWGGSSTWEQYWRWRLFSSSSSAERDPILPFMTLLVFLGLQFISFSKQSY